MRALVALRPTVREMTEKLEEKKAVTFMKADQLRFNFFGGQGNLANQRHSKSFRQKVLVLFSKQWHALSIA